MRIPSAFSVAAAAVAAASLSACSGSVAPSAGLGPAGLSSLTSSVRAGSVPHRVKLNGSFRVLYVTDQGGANDVDVLQYRQWTSIGTIDTVNAPWGDWVDNSGNLYVAINEGKTITEYDPIGNPIFTYNLGLVEPIAVTTDRFGAVYEADRVSGVSEFPQRINQSINCPNYPATGIAVDRRGDVFISSNNQILEYRHGLVDSACTPTVLPIVTSSPVGLAVDRQGNLLVADSGSAAVDIVAPPYTSITGTLGTGYTAPERVTINKAGTQAYVTDGFQTVRVLTYPSGSNVATLGSANGITAPIEAVSSNNYVP